VKQILTSQAPTRQISEVIERQGGLAPFVIADVVTRIDVLPSVNVSCTVYVVLG
jgi:hypothetical protein